MHMLLCVSYKHIAIQYPLCWAITPYPVFYYLNYAPPTTPHHLYTQDDAHNILCISCVHFYIIHQYCIQSIHIRPGHTRYTAGCVLMYLMLIVVHHIIRFLPILFRVELSI